MALNDTFTTQEINLDKKDLSFDNKLKKIVAYWNQECAEHPSNNHCKIFWINFLIYVENINKKFISKDG